MIKKTLSLLSAAAIAIPLGACGSEDSPNNPEVNPTPGDPITGGKAPSEVIYQANPRFFGNQDCLKALQKDLPRIASMGCDILWVMPIFDPGVEKSIGSPYCIRDFEAVNPRYGSVEDVKNLVEAAHAKGMKVVLDWVANHTSWDHPWISDHPERYAKDSNGNITMASTWTDVAQLDYSEPSTADAMKGAMLFWIEQTGIDGFRCDYTEGVPHSFWTDAIKSIRNVKSDAFMLAESQKTEFYNDGFDMIYDWNYSPALSDTFKGGNPSRLFSKAEETGNIIPEGKSILRYAFNHDVAAENNVATYFGSNEGIIAAYALTAMLGGTPMIYSSMDVEGLSGKQSFFDYRPLDFSDSLTDRFTKINNAFKSTAETRGGKLSVYENADVAMFSFTNGNHKLLVMVNTTDTQKTVKSPIALTGEKMTDLINGGETTIPVTVSLQPYSYIIYKN